MRAGFALLFLATTSLSTAFAGELKGTSKVDAVTVYPSGAEITRVTEVALPAGDTTLILEDLPAEADPQSIRVEGEGGDGLEIGSVDSRIVHLTSNNGDLERKRFEKQIGVLRDERQALDQVLSDADSQKKLLLSLADRQLQPASPDEKARVIDAAQLGGLLDVVSAKLNGISKAMHEAQLRQRDIDTQIADLETEMNSIAPAQGSKVSVALHVSAAAETTGVFKLKYRVSNAGWTPFYDARLAAAVRGEKSKLELVRRAEVMQGTGESWENVALTLSTARPHGATSAPDLWEHEIGVLREADGELAAEIQNQAKNALDLDNPVPAAPESKALRKDAFQRQATIEFAGFQALYGIPGRVSVDNSGTAKKVRISTNDFDSTLNAIVVPKVDATEYLTAAFTIKGGAPVLPGTVNLYRDGVFMGQGNLPLLSDGEEAKLGFGADDLIKVKRAEVKHKKGETGFISSSNTEERAWDIVVKNLHDVAIPVTVIDQMPFSANENIIVQALLGMTAPSEANLNKRRGVMAWRFELAPQAEKSISFGYKVSWPADMQVGMNLQ